MRWPAETIWQAVAPKLDGFTVEVLPQIDSTNTELMRRFRGTAGAAPRPEPTLLVAEQQTAGRGRLGRQWHSQRGDSLTFSLGLALQPVDWSGLSLVVGISLAESLDPAPRDGQLVGLKWPNDLWLGKPGAERKLAGILVETANLGKLRYAVIGVGINIRPVALPVHSAAPAARAPMPAGYLQEVSSRRWCKPSRNSSSMDSRRFRPVSRAVTCSRAALWNCRTAATAWPTAQVKTAHCWCILRLA
jgi:BirA family biotin operon repressor/biotin-[acetyl-CoA-carboxylase] ligase